MSEWQIMGVPPATVSKCAKFESPDPLYWCYKGYAVAKAEAWWAERTDEDFPSSVEEFMFLSGCLATPLQVLVAKDGKYNRVEGAVWTHEPIVDDDLPPLEPGWKVDPDDCEVPF